MLHGHISASMDLVTGTVRVRATFVERSAGEILLRPPRSKTSPLSRSPLAGDDRGWTEARSLAVAVDGPGPRLTNAAGAKNRPRSLSAGVRRDG